MGQSVSIAHTLRPSRLSSQKSLIVFGGTSELSIDSKGRLAIPAKFRELLLRHYGVLTVTVTLDSRKYFVIYPQTEWQRVQAQILAMNTLGKPNAKAYQNMVLHNAETLDLDSAGRIQLPTLLRQQIHFDKEVMLVGRVDRLEAWGKEFWFDNTNTILDMDQDVLAAELAESGFQL